MKFLIITKESVEGRYEVEADSEEDARQAFDSDPLNTGEQVFYQVRMAPEIERVERIE
jgi:predicted RNA-binding protein